MRTHVRFEHDETFELTEQAATAFAGYSTASGWSVRGALGVLIDGSLEGDGTTGAHDFEPGVVAALGVARQWRLGDAYFVNGSAGLSIATASTQGATSDARFIAGDVRIGAIAGRTFAKQWNPYVLARAFGGPVSWSIDAMDVLGSDTRHFQLGAGLSVVAVFGLTVTLDVSALGEQGASLGASWRL